MEESLSIRASQKSRRHLAVIGVPLFAVVAVGAAVLAQVAGSAVAGCTTSPSTISYKLAAAQTVKPVNFGLLERGPAPPPSSLASVVNGYIVEGHWNILQPDSWWAPRDQRDRQGGCRRPRLERDESHQSARAQAPHRKRHLRPRLGQGHVGRPCHREVLIRCNRHRGALVDPARRGCLHRLHRQAGRIYRYDPRDQGSHCRRHDGVLR